MKIKIAIFLLVLILCGCENRMRIPTHDMGSKFDYENLDFENHDKSVDQNLLRKIKEIDELTDPEVICSFNSAFGKDVFKVYLVESKTTDSNVNILLVTDHISESIIDYFTFNTDTVLLDVLYDRSEPVKDKGLVFTFINKKIKNNNIITSFDKYINLKGVIEGSKIVDNSKFTFQLLDTTMLYSGRYFYEVDSFNITLELKDGVEEENYAFELSLKTPKQCRIVYRNLKGIIENELYILDSLDEKSILLTNKLLKMNLKLNHEECGVINNQTFTLKKNNG